MPWAERLPRSLLVWAVIELRLREWASRPAFFWGDPSIDPSRDDL